MEKTGRNDPCPCQSGQKYKYCCRGFEHKNRVPHIQPEYMSDEGMEFFKNVMGGISSEEEALRCFCKDNGFYFFKCMSIADLLKIYDKLSSNTLTKEDFFVCYRKQITNEYVARMLQIAMKQSDIFKKRQVILESAMKSHFDESYELSIPAFFIIIEGILRDIGNLKQKQTFKPTMTNEELEKKALYNSSDSISYFNAFITSLYMGSQDVQTFNRNTILHGLNNSCFNEENSLTLLLTIIEVLNYVFHDRSWPPKLKMENGVAILYHPSI